MTKPFRFMMAFLLLDIVTVTWASGSINSLEISTAELSHRFDYTHYNIIGACIWEKWKGTHPHFYTTLEISEYKPDLVVTVYNQYGEDPWIEANLTLDSASKTLSGPLYEAAVGASGQYAGPLGEGNNATAMGHLSYANLRTKLVDVIGSPLNTLALAVPQLDSDTTPLLPYYQSEMDTLGRAGLAEALRPETYDPFSHPIGENAELNHWSFEFPRNMNVNVDNDFKADVVLALRASDIVTNQNTLHTVKSTANSCGHNCAVSNVIEEMDDKHAIWQEVYPLDRHIKPGEDDSLSLNSEGSQEEEKSGGDMVFVIWRQYKGCVQHSGNLIFYSDKINPTVKR